MSVVSPSQVAVRTGARAVGSLPKSLILAILVIAVLGIVAIAAPLLEPYDPNQINPTDQFAPPSAEHKLGTDALGRDLLSRLIAGSRTALLGPVLMVLLTTALGAALGIAAAWRGGWVDTAITRVLDIVFAFPAILLALLIAAMFGGGFWTAICAVAIAYVPYVARVVRAEALRVASLPFIEAAWIQGVSVPKLMVRHLLPNVAQVIVAQATVLLAWGMIDISTLSFLGVGVQPPTADWGGMVAAGLADIPAGYPEQALYASVAAVIAIAAFTIVGNYVEERLGR